VARTGYAMEHQVPLDEEHLLHELDMLKASMLV
jgi:hypothetical protein